MSSWATAPPRPRAWRGRRDTRLKPFASQTGGSGKICPGPLNGDWGVRTISADLTGRRPGDSDKICPGPLNGDWGLAASQSGPLSMTCQTRHEPCLGPFESFGDWPVYLPVHMARHRYTPAPLFALLRPISPSCSDRRFRLFQPLPGHLLITNIL